MHINCNTVQHSMFHHIFEKKDTLFSVEVFLTWTVGFVLVLTFHCIIS